MPKRFASKAQARLFQAAAHGNSDAVPKAVAKKAVAENKGKSIKGLPGHVKKGKR